MIMYDSITYQFWAFLRWSAALSTALEHTQVPRHLASGVAEA